MIWAPAASTDERVAEGETFPDIEVEFQAFDGYEVDDFEHLLPAR